MAPHTRVRMRANRLVVSLGLISTMMLGVFGGPVAQAQSTDSIFTHLTPGLGPILTDSAGRTLYILVDARGMTLYLYSRDEPAVSNCYNGCAAAWPPLLTDATPNGPDAISAGLGSTSRTDGTQQVTYNGVPLYYWMNDKNP